MEIHKATRLNCSEDPLVSIGLPVFNGGAQLQERINALLDQSYMNIELIVCDNASTDETQDVLMAAALKDKRVRYIRNPTNVGIARNFNKVLGEARGEYFMWAAHDDIHSRDFIAKCVLKLIENPSAALCQSKVAIYMQDIDNLIYYAGLDSFQCNLDISKRYKEALYNLPAVALYGIFRIAFAQEIPGFRLFPGGDLLWIQELALCGDFIQSDEILFHYIARKNWNSFQVDLRNFSSGAEFSTNAFARAIQTLFERICGIRRNKSSFITKFKLINIAIRYSVRTTLLSILIRRVLSKEGSRLLFKIRTRIYWRYLHNPNFEIINSELFKSRVISPMIGIR